MCHLQDGLSHPKTSVLSAMLANWGIAKGQRVLLIVENMTQNLLLSSRNLSGVVLTTADQILLSEILKADRIVIEPKALAYIQVILAQTHSGMHEALALLRDCKRTFLSSRRTGLVSLHCT